MAKTKQEIEQVEETEEESEYYYLKPGYGLGFICGLFTIFGLIGGFLYPTESEQREQFITGWKFGFLSIIAFSVIYILAMVLKNG